jgi:hypothetical protein
MKHFCWLDLDLLPEPLSRRFICCSATSLDRFSTRIELKFMYGEICKEINNSTVSDCVTVFAVRTSRANASKWI